MTCIQPLPFDYDEDDEGKPTLWTAAADTDADAGAPTIRYRDPLRRPSIISDNALERGRSRHVT